MERYREIIPEWEKFLRFCYQPLPKTLRVNSIKISPYDLEEIFTKQGWKFHRFDFCDYGYEIVSNHDISKTVEHWLGYYYIQEASSFIPVLVLDPQPEEKILDLCAAPGGKTTFIAQLSRNKAVIWANDIGFQRMRALLSNIYRMGVTSAVVTNYNGLFFPNKVKFDKILLDAPCSGEGNMRKDPRRLKGAEPGFIRNISGIQKGLIQRAIDILQPGGILVYSTCTLAPEENEMVIDYVINRRNVKIEKIDLSIPHAPGITKWQNKNLHSDLVNTVRIYPHHLNSGGVYIAKLRKLS
ncbi:MAG TPA: RsmB/NOP family class I SAM-dependent RNA methyltransferase [Candidatus Omnitrophica bacterium]|nr:RsmB/NOP family class I SAM-dependent RNA methyltransferase [Candidatus Omnitrophota bacterium]